MSVNETGSGNEVEGMNATDAPTPFWSRRWPKVILGGAGLAILLVVALVVWYTQFRDVEAELTSADRDAALIADATTATATAPDDAATSGPVTTGTVAGSTEPPPPASDGAATIPAADGAVIGDGSWTVATDADNEVGYRVKESIAGVATEGVGRTDQVTGSLTIDGSTLTEAAFEVDVASIKSDSSQRDGQFRGRIMSTDEYPTATFTLTKPVDLGIEPVEGATAVVDVTGELMLRGVTNTVTFPVDAALRNGRIGIVGQIPVVFADYEIENPSLGNISTGDEGLLEFVLVFEPAA